MSPTTKILGLILVTSNICLGQTTWTGNGDATFWDDAGNWSSGLPSGTVGVIFTSATGATGLASDFTIASLTFNAGAGADLITNVGGAALTINGAITNNTTNTQTLDLTINAGANATWSGPISFTNNVNIGTRQITTSGALTFSNSNLNFDITNSATFGRFLGVGTSTFSNVTINIGGAYNGNAGDAFDFTTGNFTGASVGSLPTLTSGLTWNTSQFLSQGILSVSAIPEPSTVIALAGLGVLGFVCTRRQGRKLGA